MDLLLDRDEVADDLDRTPFALGEWPPLGHSSLGGRREAGWEGSERLDQLVMAHAPGSSSTRFGASQRAASSSGTPLRVA